VGSEQPFGSVRPKKTGLNARFEMENYHESALQRSQRAIKV
jgi:hypothetical protein